MFGLAVDNLLEAEIIIADGTVLETNECSSPDLFWALKGGGGGSWGVVTRMVHKANEPAENYLKVLGSFGANNFLCNAAHVNCAEILVEAFVNFMNYTEEY